MCYRNLIAQRSLIPASHYTLTASETAYTNSLNFTFVTGVFAVEAFIGMSPDKMWDLWRCRPKGSVKDTHVMISA